MKMTAAVVYGKGHLQLEEVPVPDPPEGSVRVKVEACAICGTDIRIYRKGDYRAEYPVIVGHEIAGTIDAVASGAAGYGFREGDRVCVAPGHGCGTCRMCVAGQPNVCVRPFPSLGYKVNGGFAQYLAVPENILRLGFVNRIPDPLTFEQASIAEIVACCLNGQRNAPTRPGDVVLVIGGGPAGIIHSQLARVAGARRVILTQRSRPRLDLATRRFPIDRIVCSTEESLDEAIREETDGTGVDVAYVCAPSAEAQETAVRLAGPRSRVNLFGGLPRDGNVIRIDANHLHYKEVFLSGASSSLPVDNVNALRLLADRVVDPEQLITHRFPLERIVDAFDAAEARSGIKTVVRIE